MNVDIYEDRLSFWLGAFEEALLSSFGDGSPSEALSKAAAHYIYPAGKRIRPISAAIVAFDLGLESDFVAKLAPALEMVHAASLIHDDLPALDDDDFRRGRPSCHKAFDEATAILAGDYLVGLAFRAIASAGQPPGRLSLAAKYLSDAFSKLCEGQALDLRPHATREEKERVHLLKTGALFGASFAFGALGSESRSVCEKAYRAGERFGVLFQVADDLLDVIDSAGLKGRPQSSDKKNERETFVDGVDFERAKSEILHQEVLLEERLSELKSAVPGIQDFPGIRSLKAQILARVTEH